MIQQSHKRPTIARTLTRQLQDHRHLKCDTSCDPLRAIIAGELRQPSVRCPYTRSLKGWRR